MSGHRADTLVDAVVAIVVEEMFGNGGIFWE